MLKKVTPAPIHLVTVCPIPCCLNLLPGAEACAPCQRAANTLQTRGLHSKISPACLASVFPMPQFPSGRNSDGPSVFSRLLVDRGSFCATNRQPDFANCIRITVYNFKMRNDELLGALRSSRCRRFRGHQIGTHPLLVDPWHGLERSRMIFSRQL